LARHLLGGRAPAVLDSTAVEAAGAVRVARAALGADLAADDVQALAARALAVFAAGLAEADVATAAEADGSAVAVGETLHALVRTCLAVLLDRIRSAVAVGQAADA